MLRKRAAFFFYACRAGAQRLRQRQNSGWRWLCSEVGGNVTARAPAKPKGVSPLAMGAALQAQVPYGEPCCFLC